MNPKNYPKTSQNQSTPRSPLRVVPPASRPETPPAPADSAPKPTPPSPPQTQPAAEHSYSQWLVLGAIVAGLGWAATLSIPDTVTGKAIIKPAPDAIQPVTMPELAVIEKIYVRLNDKIRQGQPVLKLSSKELEQQFAESQRELVQAQSERDAANQRTIIAQNKVAESQLREKEAENRASKLQQEIAEATIHPRIREIEGQKKVKESELEGLNKELANIEKRIDLIKPAVEEGVLSKKTLLDMEVKRDRLLSKIRAKTREIQLVAGAQIEGAEKLMTDRLVEERQPEVELMAAAVESAKAELSAAKADAKKWESQIPALQEKQNAIADRLKNLTGEGVGNCNHP
jgi:multidrug efflux pump subunit AcrA (membrane-fusion protein)